MTFLKIGNKKERKSALANDNPKQGARRSGLPHFFVVARLTDSFATGTMTGVRIVSRNKNRSSRECEPRRKSMGVCGLAVPEIHPPCSQKGGRSFAYRNLCFSACFLAFWKPPQLTTKPFVLLNTPVRVFRLCHSL